VTSSRPSGAEARLDAMIVRTAAQQAKAAARLTKLQADRKKLAA